MIKFIKSTLMVSMLALSSGGAMAYEQEQEQPLDQPQWFYLSSFGTNEVFRFEENTGEFLGTLDTSIPAPFASFVTPDRNFYVASGTTGSVYLFGGPNREFQGVFISEGSGGLSRPTAPIMTPDGKYMIVGDLDLNGYYRYDGVTGEPLGIFAEPETSPIDGPFMPVFSPYPELHGKMLIASGYTNSIQIYDIETGEYERDLVKPGSGGLLVPIGLVFGPDGNLYTSSSGNNSVKRFNGRTGEYIDDFVPEGSGGLNAPRALEFGGPNSDLHIASSGTNEVLKFARVSGEFMGVAASGEEHGFSEPRGIMFSLRTFAFAAATPSIISPEVHYQGNKGKFAHHKFSEVKIDFHTVKGLIDDNTKVELLSITVDDPNRNPRKDVRFAKIGKDDREFLIRNRNRSGKDRVYTITYRISNEGQGSVLTTTTVTVPTT